MTSTPPQRTRRDLVRRLVTAVSGVAVLAAAGGAVVLGERTSAAVVEVPGQSVTVPAARTVQVCHGPPRLATAAAGDDLGYDEFDPEGSGTTTLLGAVSVAPAAGPPGAARLLDISGGPLDDLAAIGDIRLVTLPEVGEPVELEAEPANEHSALAAGTGVASTASGDLRGLVATACQSPAAGGWLVGGSTEPGSSAQLVLTNVDDTPATVTLQGWGGTGPVDLAGAGNVLVPAGSQRVVLLEAVVADEARLAVQLDVTGGTVSATIQDSRLRGLVPTGTDLVVPSQAPAEVVVIPGLVLAESAPEDEDPAVVRIVNPGSAPVSADLEMLGPDGSLPVPGADELVLDPGVVVDVSLAGLLAGAWSALVTADGPVTAAGMLTSEGEPSEDEPDSAPLDRAWAPATAALDSGLITVPGMGGPVTEATLMVANPGDRPVEVSLVPILADGAVGELVTLDLPAGASVPQDVAELADEPVLAVELDAEEGATLHAAAYLRADSADGSLISVLPVTADPAAAQTVQLAPAPRMLN